MNKYVKDFPSVNKLIDDLGSNDKIAHTLGISAAAVSYWRRNGIPPLRLIQLESIFGKDNIKV